MNKIVGIAFLLCSSLLATSPMLEIEPQSGLPWGLALSDLGRYPEVLDVDEYNILLSVYNQGFDPSTWHRGTDEAVLVQSSRLYVLMTRTGSIDAFAGMRWERVASHFATNTFNGEIDWVLIGSLSLGMAGRLAGARRHQVIEKLTLASLNHPNLVVRLKSMLALSWGNSQLAPNALSSILSQVPKEVRDRYKRFVAIRPIPLTDDPRCAQLIARAKVTQTKLPPIEEFNQ